MNTVTFAKTNGETKNSYTDWGLLFRPKDIAPPEPKIIRMAIDGRDGDIDLTEWAGAVRYNDRAFSLPFYMTCALREIENKATEIKNWLHGQRVKITFSDDAEYYYSARVTVSNAHADGGVGVMSMDVIASPYKYKQEKTVVNVTASGNTYVYLTNDRMTTRPKITTDGEYTITQYGRNLVPTFSTYTGEGVTYTADGSGGCIVNGTATALSFRTFADYALPAGTYTFSGFPPGTTTTAVAYIYNRATSLSTFAYNGTLTFTLEQPSSVVFRYMVASGHTAENVYIRPQLEVGDTAHAFEAYSAKQYTVNAGTFEWTGFTLRDGDQIVNINGNGNVMIEYQEGAL